MEKSRGTFSGYDERENHHFFNGNITIFNGNITIFNGNISIFNGNITTFNGNITIFNGKITTFNGTITIFNGKITIIAGVYPLVMTNVATVFRWPIEIDGLPNLKMGGCSMAMLNKQMVGIFPKLHGWNPDLWCSFVEDFTDDQWHEKNPS